MKTDAINPTALLADIAHTQVGVHEVGDSNSGPQVIKYQRATTEPGTGWPWCAAFVCWGVAKLATMRPGLLSCEARKWMPTQASVEGLIEWAQDSGQLVFTPGQLNTYRPQAGDIVCMKFATGRHCGIGSGPLQNDPETSAFVVPTIEGNTSGPYRAKTDERNGGEVATKIRGLSCITHFIRLAVVAVPVSEGANA